MDHSDQPVQFLDLKSLHRPLKDELLASIAEAIDEAVFVGGAAVLQFEKAFSDYIGCSRTVGVGSGTDALKLALQANGIGAGKTVATVPNTFIATAEAITQTGARPVFVDIDPDTCLMDPEQLEERAKQQKIDAVVPVHLYGQCADMDAINRIAHRNGMIVIEDAAQAHGATYKGRAAGSLGVAAAFSFYPGKNLGAGGEAGAVTTNDDAIADKIEILRDHGQSEKYIHEIEGTNSRLDALQARFLSIKLRHLDAWNAQRCLIADIYDGAFAVEKHVSAVKLAPDQIPSRHLYVIHVPDRAAVQQQLSEKRIVTALHYPIPLHLQVCYSELGYKKGDFPHAEQSAATLLSLPIHPEMKASDAERVVAAVLAAL